MRKARLVLLMILIEPTAGRGEAGEKQPDAGVLEPRLSGVSRRRTESRPQRRPRRPALSLAVFHTCGGNPTTEEATSAATGPPQAERVTNREARAEAGDLQTREITACFFLSPPACLSTKARHTLSKVSQAARVVHITHTDPIMCLLMITP